VPAGGQTCKHSIYGQSCHGSFEGHNHFKSTIILVFEGLGWFRVEGLGLFGVEGLGFASTACGPTKLSTLI